VRQCLESLGQVRYPHWEIILVDQSDDDATRAVCEASLGTRSQLTYLRMREKGLSRARNLALEASNGDIVAFLDDDCTVEPDWLDTIWAVFRRHPKAALVYGTVHAVSAASGAYVPQYVVKAERRLHGRLGAVQAEGMGASMYLRREAWQRVGPFDTWLGAGARFLSSEDWDYTYRVLAAGGSVVETPEVRVMHYGARDYKSGAASRLLRGNAFSHGALHMKLLRSGQFAVVALIVAEAWRDLLLIRPVNLLLRRGPSNVSRILMYARGLLASFQLSVDRARCLYVPPRGPRWLRRPVGSFLPFRAAASPNGASGARADREAAVLQEVPLPFDGG
jgi:GT2 family glycosyltransferase